MQNQSAKIVAHKSKLDFSWVIGGLAAVAFYLVLPSIPLDENFKYRYFNSHWIEHCTVALFYWPGDSRAKITQLALRTGSLVRKYSGWD